MVKYVNVVLKKHNQGGILDQVWRLKANTQIFINGEDYVSNVGMRLIVIQYETKTIRTMSDLLKICTRKSLGEAPSYS